MLRPSEISVDRLSDAPALGLTLLLPRSKYEQPMLIAGLGEQKMAVFLGEQYSFEGFACTGDERFEGMLIPEVVIELDHTSLFNPADRNGFPAGAVFREGTRLTVAAHVRDDGHGFKRLQRVSLLDGLPSCAEREAVGFHRWQVVLGEGENKRVLRQIDVGGATAT